MVTGNASSGLDGEYKVKPFMERLSADMIRCSQSLEHTLLITEPTITVVVPSPMVTKSPIFRL